MNRDERLQNDQVARPWRGRGDLKALVQELERQRDSRIDFIADSRSLDIGVRTANDKTSLVLKPAESERNRVNDWLLEPQVISDQALKQVAERLLPDGASHKYTFVDAYRRENMAHCARFLDQRLSEHPERHLVRCLDGHVRALLSDKYRILDNYDLAFSALKIVHERGGEVIEAALSDTHMRLKFVSRGVWDTIEQARQRGEMHKFFRGSLGNEQHLRTIGVRDAGELPGGPGTVYPVATISNSETGHGRYNVRIGLLADICSNLMTVESISAHIHLGERHELGIYSDHTIELESRAIVAKACDALRAAFTPEMFKKIVAKCRRAQSVEIESPSSAVANFVENHDLTERDKDSLLKYFVRDYDSTAYGFAQALARMSQDVVDPDRANDLEELAGEVINDNALVIVR